MPLPSRNEMRNEMSVCGSSSASERFRGFLLKVRMVVAAIGFQLLDGHPEPAGSHPEIDAGLHEPSHGCVPQ